MEEVNLVNLVKGRLFTKFLCTKMNAGHTMWLQVLNHSNYIHQIILFAHSLKFVPLILPTILFDNYRYRHNNRR